MNFNAYYDVSRDKIVNADPFSYSWFHERRHQKQFNTIKQLKSFNQWAEVLTYSLSSGFLLAFILNLLTFYHAVLFIGLFNIPYALVNLFLELDAIIFGTWNWYKHHYLK